MVSSSIEQKCDRCIADLAYRFGQDKVEEIRNLFDHERKSMEEQAKIYTWIPSIVTGKVYSSLIQRYVPSENTPQKALEAIKKEQRIISVNLSKSVTKNQAVRVLELLADGHAMYYSARSGIRGKAWIVSEKENRNIKYEKVSIDVFSNLHKERLIIQTKIFFKNYQTRYHEFTASYFKPVEIYGISDVGKSFLEFIK